MKGMQCRQPMIAFVLALSCSLVMVNDAEAEPASSIAAESAATAEQQPSNPPESKVVAETSAPFRLKDDLQSHSSQQGGRSVATLVFGLFAVLAAIFGLAWLSKRFNLNLPGTSSNMKLLGALSVGAKEKLILVEVEGSKLLLGVTPQQINLLKNFDAVEAQAQQSEFSDKMLKLLKTEAGDDL